MKNLLWGFLILTRSALAAAGPSDGAWDVLTKGAGEVSAFRRAQAITAIGTIRLARADKLVETALSDKDATVRLAAVNALAEKKSRALIPKLKLALDDEVAEVSFRAALALWDLGDRSGRDLLRAVLAGERKQSQSFVSRQVKDAKSTLHNRKALVWMGAKEGAGFLFGPLGYGMGMVEGMTKDNSAPERALAAAALGQDKDPKMIEDLTAALDDKSPLVRITAAKALGGYADRSVVPKLEPLLDDKHDAVRYMAAASIVRLTEARPKTTQ
jgi:HEAT repeat protein